MRIRLLGTAAGGGVPQWNCNCPVCREARAGTGRVRTRTQSSVAVSADGHHWFLLNASPDIRSQIESAPALQPAADKARNSPIEAVLLTNADLDHTLGLLLLREGETLRVHATASVQRSLTKGLSLPPTLAAFCGIRWGRPPVKPSPLRRRDGTGSGLLYHGVALAGRPPRFARGNSSRVPGHVIGYRITDEQTGGRLLFLPDVAVLDHGVARLLPECEALLFDGTFWSDKEMQQRGASTRSAASMGHLPISGARGSLKVLAGIKVNHKIYVHINNTNPILFEDSPERHAVVAAGCTVGHDGMEIEI
jgi:pyrroloquinoline quinone biosynthesis protein B